MTRFKNELFEYLREHGGKETDGVIIDGVEYAYRPGISEEIDPKIWYTLFKEKRISENQFFRAIKISVTDAKKAVGTDQIEDISVETLSKTSTLRKEEAPGLEDGQIRTFIQKELKTKEELRVSKKPLEGTGMEIEATPVVKKNRKVIKVRR